MITTRMKQAIAAGMIGLTALGGAVAVPAFADAQEPTEAEVEERQAERAERRAAKLESLSSATGISVEALQEGREAGMNLAEIAAANGVDIDVVIQAIVDAKTDRINAAVEEGRIDADQAAEKLESLEEHVTDRVNGEGGERGVGFRGPRGPRGAGGEGVAA